MAGKQPVAIVFDTFGSVVDWRSSLIADLTAYGASRNVTADWTALADAWRAAYQPSMARVRKGELPWTKLDDLHRASLDKLIADFGIQGFSEADLQHINLVWHRLNPWPDSVPGLTRLKSRFIIGPLSNGTVSLLLNLRPDQVMMAAAHNGDLAAARACGLMTAFWPRPHEYGPHQKRDYAADQDWDVVATDIQDLASQLGV